ncbi:MULTISPECIES: VOC family protein [Legionella]|uniref:VOC family protein n=1 Tax=Legionella septentrionalis TaxID=2498109 RepID=A0A433JL39_9GAMM|nr:MULTISPECIES: VOC family protein [Legionella]MCP0913441.1 VOC family protein [Legionella sp. 27cVA30]RUQ89781.1 VOC family protein [Legionella septentrionalis]RUQ99569.1 VOC family protein [Legionella septentrionalis]RUR09824.1 VOC family protein [Legionella septentrionalis]
MSTQPTFGEFCWNELATSDLQAAKDFYGNLFDWQFVDHDMGNGQTYTMIKAGGDEFAGIWEISKEKAGHVPPHWMSYVLVRSIEESLKKAQQYGAQIQVPNTPVGDFGQFAVIIDPTGARIALWESLSQ